MPAGIIEKSQLDSINIVVNVFDGNEKSRVEYQIDDQPARIMKPKKMIDPFFLTLYENYKEHYPSWIKPRLSNHIWIANSLKDLKVGIHKLTVIATNEWGESFQVSRIFEIR